MRTRRAEVERRREHEERRREDKARGRNMLGVPECRLGSGRRVEPASAVSHIALSLGGLRRLGVSCS